MNKNKMQEMGKAQRFLYGLIMGCMVIGPGAVIRSLFIHNALSFSSRELTVMIVGFVGLIICWLLYANEKNKAIVNKGGEQGE